MGQADGSGGERRRWKMAGCDPRMVDRRRAKQNLTDFIRGISHWALRGNSLARDNRSAPYLQLDDFLLLCPFKLHFQYRKP